jgi:hypothetical protein
MYWLYKNNDCREPEIPKKAIIMPSRVLKINFLITIDF